MQKNPQNFGTTPVTFCIKFKKNKKVKIRKLALHFGKFLNTYAQSKELKQADIAGTRLLTVGRLQNPSRSSFNHWTVNVLIVVSKLSIFYLQRHAAVYVFWQ